MCKSIGYWQMAAVQHYMEFWPLTSAPLLRPPIKMVGTWSFSSILSGLLYWHGRSSLGLYFFCWDIIFYRYETASCFIWFDLGFILVFSVFLSLHAVVCFLFGDGNVNFCERWIKFLSIKFHLWSWVWGVTPSCSCRPGTSWCSPRGALSNQAQISKETLTH